MIYDNDDTVRFVRSHRADERVSRHRRKARLSPTSTVAALGVILLIATGVMINVNLGII